MPIPSAPSAAPNSVSVSEVTFSSITVQWGAVDCIHQNGDITGYSVQYGEVGRSITHTLSSTRFSGTISNLLSSTEYFIEVAAVNTVGIGVYSNAIIIETKQSNAFLQIFDCIHFHLYLHILFSSPNVVPVISDIHCG